MAQTLPATLAILPLPRNTVLYPHHLLSIQLQSRHAIALVRSVVNEAASTSGSSRLVIACVPLAPIDPTAEETRKLFSDAEPKSSQSGEPSTIAPATPPSSSNSRKLIALTLPSDQDPQDDAGSLADGRPLPGELYDHGTAARIVRLERLSTGGFLAVLEGVARISIDASSYPSLPALAPFYTAKVALLPSAEVLPSSQARLVTHLREVALSILTLLPGSSTPIVPLFDRKLRLQLSRLSGSTVPSFLDSLFHNLPSSASTSITHWEKCRILAIPAIGERVEFALKVLTRVEETLKSTPFQGDKVGQLVITNRQREYALMQQLLAIKQELDSISTPQSNRSPAKNGRTKATTSYEDEEAGEADELAELREKIEVKSFTEEARAIALREFKRLKKSPPQGAEYGVIRTYIETLLSVPWTEAEATPLPLSSNFIEQARKKLDEDHYGLTKIKKRLLEWLAVLRLQQEQLQEAPTLVANDTSVATPTDLSTSTEGPTPVQSVSPRVLSTPVVASQSRLKAPILLLHGPPGVGKTSIVRSLAEALGRKFVRISLGGVRDEAEIRGHRRTYVGAMPGKLVSALRKAGTSNPVILLDEIDKLGHASHQGDPSAAMLEVLDPEQNWCFEDHYLGTPLDLSHVLFIATANSLETISEPLYDRMEPVELSGYIHDEKLFIARQKLLPKQIVANGLDSTLISLSDSTIFELIRHYTREAGVRTLERVLGAVCRAKAVEYSQVRDQVRTERDCNSNDPITVAEIATKGYRVDVEPEDIELILGAHKDSSETVGPEGKIGVSTGLAYQGSGNGGILHIETALMPGTGNFHLTGQLGDVISESARVAFAWVKSHAYDLGLSEKPDQDVFKNVDLHLHLPSGSVKKDGPSAGVAIVVAIVSLMRGVAPKGQTAMTGEVTLRGEVTPVGGIKEKLLGAHRSGIKTVILPDGNRKDVMGVDVGIPRRVLEDITIIWARSISEVITTVLLPGFTASSEAESSTAGMSRL